MKRLVIAGVALALIAAACGGGSQSDGVASLEDDVTAPLAAGGDSSTDGSVATTEVDAELAMLEFTQCLRDQGLDVSDPEVDADGNLQFGGRPGGGGGEDPDFDREAFREARTACAHILQGVSLEFREFDRTDIEDTLVEFASCMRTNGYDMPDPDFSGEPGSGGGGGPFADIDRDDPAFVTASEACQDVLTSAFGENGPGAGRGPGGGGGDS